MRTGDRVTADAVLKVAIEQHLLEAAGKMNTDTAFSYDYWREYLEVFGRVVPIARVGSVGKVPEGWIRASVTYHLKSDQ